MASMTWSGVSGKGDGTVWRSRGPEPSPGKARLTRAPNEAGGWAVLGEQGDWASWGAGQGLKGQDGDQPWVLGKWDIEGLWWAGATEALDVN